MTQPAWYLHLSGKPVGPLGESEVHGKIASGEATPATLVFGPGLGAWTPLRSVPHFASAHGPSHPPLPTSTSRSSHVVDHELFGDDMQFVEIELDPGETVIAEAGAMMHMEDGIEMETKLGDGSKPDQGFMGNLVGLGKRFLTRESLFMTWFTNRGSGKKRVAFSAPYPGKIIPLDLQGFGKEFFCQKDAFLCAAKGTSVDIAFNKRLGAGLFGGEGFILQKLSGDGMAYVHAGGTVAERQLKAGEMLRVDTGCIVGFTGGVHYDIQMVKGIGSMLFGGEGLFWATLQGPGTVWLQSLPFSRLAGRIYASAPQVSGGRGVGEGSILGGIGDMISGD